MPVEREKKRLTAWEAVKLVERSYKSKDLFFDLSIEAARIDEEEVERVRRLYAEGRIGFDEALKRFREIIESGERGRSTG